MKAVFMSTMQEPEEVKADPNFGWMQIKVDDEIDIDSVVKCYALALQMHADKVFMDDNCALALSVWLAKNAVEE